MLISDIGGESQVILCAMDRPELDNFKATAKLTELNGDKLLSSKDYARLKEELSFLDYI
ncbi:hypothetical protein [Azohydromonas australica]|uniref:hypothetical protein n=1 Tax=Azohydromonas australica TaxID=364039 RepID=UPI0012EB79D9|nr:hypothetical protein [Azohydromonas australica]